ncbi:MAG: hypothetical protein HY258_06190, partial [Chloroflexi bacterium]|nr:hypothetical protein [Chloroflexota bacterium]
MHSLRMFRVLTLFVLAISLLVVTTPARAQSQSRSVAVPRRDADITILKNGNARFVETWQVQFSGTPGFTFAFRAVGLQNVTAVTDFSVSENNQAYRPTTSNDPNTFFT